MRENILYTMNYYNVLLKKEKEKKFTWNTYLITIN